ncbi:glycosyltransferase [Telluribacter sp. SYSU D00476]|uniref:CgeB family protein n=1 Tax=Telluribacter sp. SYSU D00476 TaxID=2811430 RepID=UPI001FF5AD8B|nr:glycosyltransferase [Telluribacter sp. SYSU D00476]
MIHTSTDNMSINILYIGDDNPFSTSYHRASALKRLGHSVISLNPKNAVRGLEGPIISKLHFHTGYKLIQRNVRAWLLYNIENINKVDLIWINGGELLGKECIQILKRKECPIILYNNDDPTGGRDGSRFNSLLDTISDYDLCVVMREINVPEYKSLGAKKVISLTMSYDEVAHQPFESYEVIPAQFRSEVAFIGTWMRHEKRDKFLIELLRQGVPVSIWGSRWQKSPYWNLLKDNYRGGALGGRDYVAAIQGSKVCIGMLSKGNRDLHTQRTLEVPYAGGLLCAERTTEHQNMYVEGLEAVFWSDANECAMLCKKLLANNKLRESIRFAGMKKVRALGVGNEDVCRKILNAVQTTYQMAL